LEAGLTAGVVNIIPGMGHNGHAPSVRGGVDKVASND